MKYLLTLLWLLGAIAAQAQEYTGHVADKEDGAPVAGAIVTARDSLDKPLGYTTTSASGDFVLRPRGGGTTAQLDFSTMGYRRQSIPADAGRMLVLLTPEATGIREVTIRAPRLSFRGDTVSYNVSRFTEAQDRSIADVLRKMPGIEVAKSGEIRYNDPCSYRRTTLSDGLTVRYDAGSFSVASITSYQYSDDEMILDQDFLPLSYFTLKQARTEHTLTEDIVFRSHERGAYRWLLGAFGFYRHGVMNAPVHFKQTGIEELILSNANEHDPQYTYDAWDNDELLLGSRFRNPSAGGALYHESNYTAGRWRFTAGLRFDYEHTRLRYRSSTQTGYTATDRVSGTTGHYPLSIDIRNTLKRNFTEVLPKFSVLYAFDEIHNLYVSVAKGYKAGGFNTQMFSDVLQQKMMNEMGFGTVYDADKVVSYEPEYSWNYELGGHFSCMEGAVRGDFALFYIDCRDQQLTIFPEGTTTGRMMTNAGRTRSFGGELSLQVSPWQNLDINAAYGYTNAKFVRYNDGKTDYKGNYLPYAPQHTLSANGAWTIPTGVQWLGNIVLQAGVRCAGRIWWNEENSLSQPFYALVEASLRFEQKHYSVDIWGRNLADAGYNVFYFKSIGNEFVQRGRPRTFGITLNINL